MAEQILQVEGLTARVEDKVILHEVGLTIKKGETHVLMGPNGAGKTTTMNLILNAVTKDGGDILVFGQDNLSHEKEVKQRIGVVQDECNLPFMFSPTDIETIMRQIYAQWDSNRYWELLNRFDLPVKQEIGSFSKGMKVKMNFAIALAHHAELLLLDEATSGLDPVMRDDMLDLLLDFVQSEERGVLFSTHIMSDLSKIADYIAFLHKGRLLFFESKDELIYHYGLIHCGEKLFREIDRGDILAWRKQDYEYQILVADRGAAARKYKGCVIDPATLDDIMLLHIKGGSL